MEVVDQVLHMNGGTGDTSYANNSLFQKNGISMTKPITDDAITNLYCTISPKSLVIADLGCSSGPNSLFVISELIKVVDELRQKLGHPSLEYQVLLNDLTGNDFNTIFKSLPSFQKKMSNQLGAGVCPIFISGVPGSFYSRLFPSKSLHFVHSSYSLNWLSQGLIEEEIMNSFNIPLYSPSLSEVKSEVLKEGSFTIDHLETSEVNWIAYDSELMMNSPDAFFYGGYCVAKCIRAAVEPLLISHFGDAIIEEVFCRYREILSNCLSKETNNSISVIVSVTKKG